MKRRNLGSCSVQPEAEGETSSSRRRLNSLVFGRYLLHQLQSRGKVLKRSFANPQNYFKLLSLYGIAPPPPDAVPLDLSFTSKSSRPTGLPPPVSKIPKSPVDKELTWKPVLKPSSSAQVSPGKKWFPVSRNPAATGEKPTFFPLTKEGKNNLHFPWMNPLNRIFLQEKSNGEGDEVVVKKDCRTSPKKTTESPSLAYERVSSASAMKPTAPNPFKITPTSSWPLDNSEHPSKPILAPPKFGANSSGANAGSSPGATSGTTPGASSGISTNSGANTGFGQYGSSAASVPLVRESRILTPPTLNVSSCNETPKPTFKLKPPVLGGNSSVSSPVSFKRPASNLSASPSSPDYQPDIDARNDAKRARLSQSLEGASSLTPDTTLGEEEEDDVDDKKSFEISSTSEAKIFSPVSSSSSSLSRETVAVTTTSQNNSPTRSVPTFVPLTNNSTKEISATEESPSRVNGVGATSPPLSSKVGNAGFIFGQNLENRVSGVPSSSTSMRYSNGETNPSSPSSGQNLFTAAANNLATPSATMDGAKSLSESSREFSLKEESLKTKYEEVQLVTGEEGEKNVIQMNCKLYGWGSGSWQERGRGILRLNDREIRDELHSRLVIRTQGTLTVMLNAKIWADMSIEKPNDKSVRFTASDMDGQPKIYLVMGSPKDITLLHNSLEYRVAAARSQTLDEKERESEQDQDTLPPLSV